MFSARIGHEFNWSRVARGSRVSEIGLGLSHRQSIVIADHHQDRSASVTMFGGDRSVHSGRVVGDVRGKSQLVLGQFSTRTLEGSRMGNFSAERETEDGKTLRLNAGITREGR